MSFKDFRNGVAIGFLKGLEVLADLKDSPVFDQYVYYRCKAVTSPVIRPLYQAQIAFFGECLTLITEHFHLEDAELARTMFDINATQIQEIEREIAAAPSAEGAGAIWMEWVMEVIKSNKVDSSK
jgi:hypothetical protein